MALNFFKQSDIDIMDINDIPEEFVNYFDTLDDGGKAVLLGGRKDLAAALGFDLEEYTGKQVIKENIEADAISSTSFDSAMKTQPESVDSPDDELENIDIIDEETHSDDLFEQIKNNAYAGKNLDKIVKDDMSPFEVLAIGDSDPKCILHHSTLKEKNIRFKVPNYPTFGLNIKMCKQCKRLYMEESKMGYAHVQLMSRNIPHTFYDLDTTKKYLQTQIKPYQFTEESKLFFQKTWIEENPTCLCKIDKPKLHMIPCEKVYRDRKVSFTGYQCEICKRIYVRRSKAFDLEDECAELGIPKIRRFRVERRIPKKKAIPSKEIHPNYYVKNGHRLTHVSENMQKYYKLTEDDILVVSDVKACMLDDHETEPVLALIRVDEKRDEEHNTYACEVGFCSDCMKYYIEAEDYNVMYSLGRPEVSVIIDLDQNNYHITSGSEFSLEKDHLKNVENVLNGEVSKITSKSDYVSKYATGDYDDGQLRFQKQAAGRYDDTLQMLYRFMPKPYSYRVDIMSEDESETYYIGASDITLNGTNYVISANSNFGHQLVSYQTTRIKKNGREYRLKLTRQFDISHSILYGYTNVRTDEDAIFKKGITDPFLIRVLNMRKKQHNLTDIFVTIQENQNKIVNAKFKQNLVVQGCAGSGKTMVLLHRLSSLSYKESTFDFGANALILTPNDHFTLHIKGLSEDLQIRYIDKLTVEQYYLKVLLEYSNEFKLDRKLSSEMIVRQDFVNYIYSDRFLRDFSQAFRKIIDRRNNLAESISKIANKMNINQEDYDFQDNIKVTEKLNRDISALSGFIRITEEKYKVAFEDLQKTETRKKYLISELPDIQDFITSLLDEALPRVFAKIQGYRERQNNWITGMERELLKLKKQNGRAIKPNSKEEERKRIIELRDKISSLETRIQFATQKRESEAEILTLSNDEKSSEELLAWIHKVMKIVPDVADEARLCDRALDEYRENSNELSTIDERIEEEKEKLIKAEEGLYSKDIKNDVKTLQETISQYTLQNTFQMIFDEATDHYRKTHEIKDIRGKYHRYDLYARLLFARDYFKKLPNTIGFMCIDEGQDISINEYKLIKELNDNQTIFNIFGDINQLMKPGRGITKWADLDKIIGTTKYTLNENYRNTNQITNFCNDSFNMNVTLTGVDGANVKEILRNDLESELASLKLISERVAVLVPRKINKNKYLNKELLSEELLTHIGDRIDNGYISLMYVDEVKGIEFDKAYVVSKGMTRNEKYIAYTRALSELIIVVDERIKG